MKASWLKRIYRTNEGWATIPKLYGLNIIYMYGDIFLEKQQREVNNVFWGDVIKSVLFIYKHSPIKCREHLMATPIWYNTNIIEAKLTKWVYKGITTIIIASSGSSNQQSGFVPCDRSLNPHNALHRRALNVTP